MMKLVVLSVDLNWCEGIDRIVPVLEFFQIVFFHPIRSIKFDESN